MGHPAADALQVEEPSGVRELLGGPVAGEPAGRFLDEHSLGYEIAEDGVQGISVAAGRLGQAGDVGVAIGDVFGDAQGGRHHEAPRCLQVEHPVQVDAVVGGAVLRGAVLSAAGLARGAGLATPGCWRTRRNADVYRRDLM